MAELTNFVDTLRDFGQAYPRQAPPISVFHPAYGQLGTVGHRGFRPLLNRWASTKAILADANRTTIQALRRMEELAPKALAAAIGAWVMRDPVGALPLVIGSIQTYDQFIAARGAGQYQDIWMWMTATQTPVTTSWYDMLSYANVTPATVPTVTAFANASTGGAVLDATSNGSWLSNPQGTNKKYLHRMGLSTTSLTGFGLAMLYDCLWAGSYSLTANATITPTSAVPVTRWTSTTSGNVDWAAGNMMQCSLTATLTHTVAGTVTTTYTDQAGAGSKTTISTMPATGPLIYRILFNTIHNSATVTQGNPFMPLSNAGSSGVRRVDSVTIAGGTVSSGAIHHKIVRPLGIWPFIAAASLLDDDMTLSNLVELRNVSQVCGCLGWNLLSAGTTAAACSFFAKFVEG